MVKEGRDLKRVARVLGLPLWTRRLPPEAFRAPFGDLPDGEVFNRKIVNLIPRDPGSGCNVANLAASGPRRLSRGLCTVACWSENLPP